MLPSIKCNTMMNQNLTKKNLSKCLLLSLAVKIVKKKPSKKLSLKILLQKKLLSSTYDRANKEISHTKIID